MKLRQLFLRSLMLLLVASSHTLLAQSPSRNAVSTSSAAIVEEATADGRYAFLLFYKQNDAATQSMLTTLKAALESEANGAVMVPVQVGSPANQALVAKHDVARAPMPMLISLAPNGAVTGVFASKLSAANVQECFVTPTMMTAMKSLQEGKLVFVAVQGAIQTAPPVALKDFQTDPHFKTRTVVLKMQGADPQEAKFMSQMQLDPSAKTTKTVLLAPPGVLVGKFEASATLDEIAGALAEAGKCCDDPNCKHHKPAPPRTASPPPPATRRK